MASTSVCHPLMERGVSEELVPEILSQDDLMANVDMIRQGNK
jgi:hypothetical protein